MFKIYHILLFLSLCLARPAMAQQQTPLRDLAARAHFTSSSNRAHEGHRHGGESTYCLTEGFGGLVSDPEQRPWFEADLGADYHLNSVRLGFQAADYPGGLTGFYVLTSRYPMDHVDLPAMLSSPEVEHLYVEGPWSTQDAIPLADVTARYLRVQSAQPAQLIFSDVVILGADVPPAATAAPPVFRSVVATQPSCPDCHDGKLYVLAGGDRLELSTDGGGTFQSIPAGGGIDLPAVPGVYNLVLRSPDGATVAYPKNPVTVPDNADAAEVTRCGNGDFMNGWTGWTGWQGVNAGGPNNVTVQSNVISAPRQVILNSSAALEPNAPQIVLNSPTGQAQFARLGDLSVSNSNAQSLTFTFAVTPQNYNFNFWHAVVLNRHSSPPSSAALESFFSWTVTTANGAVIATRMFNSLNGTLTPVNPAPTGGTWFFSNWQQECVNLGNFIGQQVTITFVSAGCSGSGHGGRAYIDGLCVPTNAAPVPNLRSQNVMCQGGAPVTVNLQYLTTSIPTYASHFWTIERVNANNQPVAGTAFNSNITVGNPAPLSDPIGLWSSLSGQLPQCGQRFRVTLNVLDLACNIGASSTLVVYDCVPAMEYCDLAVCNLAPAQLQVQAANSPCSTCTYEWTPDLYVSNPSSALPQLANPGALDIIYTVTIESENGCVREEEVEVWDAMLSGTLSVTHTCVDECSVQLEASFTTNKTFVPGRVTLAASSAQRNLAFTYHSQVSLGGGYYRYKFVSAPFENEGTGSGGANPEQFTVSITSVTPPGFCNYGNCPSSISTTYQVGRGLFHGVPNVYVPNVFQLSDPNPVNRYFNPFFSDGIAAPGVYWCDMKVYDKWGSLVYEQSSDSLFTASCASTIGFIGTEPGLPYGNELNIFPWNGYIGNDKYTNTCGIFNNLSCKCPQGVYTYVIRFRNCEKDSNGKPIVFQMAGEVLLLW